MVCYSMQLLAKMSSEVMDLFTEYGIITPNNWSFPENNKCVTPSFINEVLHLATIKTRLRKIAMTLTALA